MKVAIVIGVSEYPVGAAPLPAASLDAAAMKRLLDATGEYDSVLDLAGNLESEETKRRLMKFLEPYEEPTLDEVLFYYSGHGIQVPSGLAFAMSDFDAQHLVRGSIENEELDSYLRSVDAKVAVKILDCCYSGLRYIKGPKATLDPTPASKGLDGCYFFSSSRHDQESWTGPGDNSLSVFTQYFLDAVASQPDGPVRYKQIADSIMDRFLKEEQEPQFNIQGNMRHVFCSIDQKVRLAASSPLEVEEATPAAASPKEDDAVAIVKQRARSIINQEEADQVLGTLKSGIEELTPPSVLEELYEERIWFPASMDLDDDVACELEIGRWLKHGGRGFFGWATETDPDSKPISVATMMPGYRERPRVTGFVSSASVEYDRFFVRHTPRFEGLLRWEMAVVILWSPRQAAVFSYGVPLERLSWDRYDQPEDPPCRRELFPKSRLDDLVSYVLEVVENHRAKIKTYVDRYTGVDT